MHLFWRWNRWRLVHGWDETTSLESWSCSWCRRCHRSIGGARAALQAARWAIVSLAVSAQHTPFVPLTAWLCKALAWETQLENHDCFVTYLRNIWLPILLVSGTICGLLLSMSQVLKGIKLHRTKVWVPLTSDVLTAHHLGGKCVYLERKQFAHCVFHFYI